MIVEHILSGITKEEESRERTSPLRMSSSGKCGRAIAYQLHGYKAADLSSRANMVFRLGHTIESEVKALIEKYCSHLKITYPKDTLTIQIDGKTIVGHIDGLIEDHTVLEVKSINGMRFKMLDREGIPADYKAQACSYMKALNVTKTLFVFYCKDTSHLKEMYYDFDPVLWEQVHTRFFRVIHSTKDDLPEREYGPVNGKLVWNCGYCSYVSHCWPQAKLVFDKNNKPQYLIGEKNV